MKGRTIVSLLLSLAFILPLTVRADQDKDKDRDNRRAENAHHDRNVNTPVDFLGVIPIPGNPITSADISWVDPGTERYYFADRSNFGVDIIDAETNFFVGRVSGMAGALPSGGGTTTTNGPGPNGVLVTPNRKL